MTDPFPSYFELIFCGQPGTLKTFLSSRIAHRLGAVWLPTVSIAAISTQSGVGLSAERESRYARCVDALHVLAGMRARVVVDGGFPSMEIKHQFFAIYPDCPKVLIECAASAETRLARLKTRAQSPFDVERASAASILETWSRDQVQPAPSVLSTKLVEAGCTALLRVNTTSFTVSIEGTLDNVLRESILAALESAFEEFRATDKSYARAAMTQSFDELAPRYEENTEWRAAPELLAQLRVDLPRAGCDVLDIGSGTGLAAEWYSAQGHRCMGLDLSPKMSVRAAPRVLFTNFGSAVDLPFFEASFDLALMRQMLHYTEPALALQETRRILRADGQLVIAAAIAQTVGVKPVWEEFKNVTQPLRLRVFAEDDLAELLYATGFTIVERRHASLTRRESFAQVAQRAREPTSGWASFMKMMERVFAGLAPELEFKVAEDAYSYRQFWVTLVARKAEGVIT